MWPLSPQTTSSKRCLCRTCSRSRVFPCSASTWALWHTRTWITLQVFGLHSTQLVFDLRFLWGVLESKHHIATQRTKSLNIVICHQGRTLTPRWNFQNSVSQTVLEPVVLYGILLYSAFEGGLSRIWKISGSSRQQAVCYNFSSQEESSRTPKVTVGVCLWLGQWLRQLLLFCCLSSWAGRCPKIWFCGVPTATSQLRLWKGIPKMN